METLVVTGRYRVAVEDNDSAPWSEQTLVFTPDGAFRAVNAKLGTALVPLPDAVANLRWMKDHQLADPITSKMEAVPIDAVVFRSLSKDSQDQVVRMGLYNPNAAELPHPDWAADIEERVRRLENRSSPYSRE